MYAMHKDVLVKRVKFADRMKQLIGSFSCMRAVEAWFIKNVLKSGFKQTCLSGTERKMSYSVVFKIIRCERLSRCKMYN